MDTDKKGFAKAKSLNKKGLIREISMQVAWLIRDIAMVPIFFLTLLLQQRAVFLIKRLWNLEQVRKQRQESLIVKSWNVVKDKLCCRRQVLHENDGPK